MKVFSLIKLFDMRTGYAPVRNIFGISDPSVHFIDNHWTMFVGGFNTQFKTNIYSLRLPLGAPLSSAEWSFVTEPDNPRKAKPVIAQPDKTSWDGYGLHSPSYACGIANGSRCERIYYAGRSSTKVTDNDKPYRIGVLTNTDRGWKHQAHPLPITGSTLSPSVLEPKVEYQDGKWRMRYVTTPIESSKTQWPNYTIMYTESDDGLTNWSEPKVFFTSEEGYYDSVVISIQGGYGMAVTRNSNLYARSPYPTQGVWWLEALTLSSDRNDWTSEPLRIIRSEDDTEGWYANGMCGPSMQFGNSAEDKDTLYLFFVSTTQRVNWFAAAWSNLLKGKRPPVPAPYYFAIGRVDIREVMFGNFGNNKSTQHR